MSILKQYAYLTHHHLSPGNPIDSRFIPNNTGDSSKSSMWRHSLRTIYTPRKIKTPFTCLGFYRGLKVFGCRGVLRLLYILRYYFYTGTLHDIIFVFEFILSFFMVHLYRLFLIRLSKI